MSYQQTLVNTGRQNFVSEQSTPMIVARMFAASLHNLELHCVMFLDENPLGTKNNLLCLAYLIGHGHQQVLCHDLTRFVDYTAMEERDVTGKIPDGIAPSPLLGPYDHVIDPWKAGVV